LQEPYSEEQISDRDFSLTIQKSPSESKGQSPIFSTKETINQKKKILFKKIIVIENIQISK